MFLLIGLLLLPPLLFCCGLAALWLAEIHPPAVAPDSGAVIVLGCQVYPTGRLSPQLELRVTAALETYRKHPRPIIVCGGRGQNEPAPEGQVMREWLIARGAAPEDVTAECDSTSTRMNIRYAKALLPESVRRVTVITSDYHLPRALALARDEGLEADGIGSPCRPEIQFWMKNHLRETFAWGKYLLEKVLKKQG